MTLTFVENVTKFEEYVRRGRTWTDHVGRSVLGRSVGVGVGPSFVVVPIVTHNTKIYRSVSLNHADLTIIKIGDHINRYFDVLVLDYKIGKYYHIQLLLSAITAPYLLVITNHVFGDPRLFGP